MKRYAHVLMLAILVLSMGAAVVAQVPVFRISAETQWTPPNGPEYITTAAPAADGGGGTVTYTKTFYNLYPVLYISFDGAGAAHNGATLLMSCLVNGVPCAGLGAGGGTGPSASIPTGWVGLLKQPTELGNLNCNTQHIFGGLAEFGDCHTNSINYTWCVQAPTLTPVTVELKLASLPGVVASVDRSVHYERAYITVDATKQPTSPLCVADAPEILNGF